MVSLGRWWHARSEVGVGMQRDEGVKSLTKLGLGWDWEELKVA